MTARNQATRNEPISKGADIGANDRVGSLEISKQAAESRPKRIENPNSKGAPERLVAWESMAEGPYAQNTRRAQTADGGIFQTFCERTGMPYSPVSPQTIRAFVEDCVKKLDRTATIRRYAATVARAHIEGAVAALCESGEELVADRERACGNPRRGDISQGCRSGKGWRAFAS